MAEQTVSRKLLEPILDQGIQNTNFFNGRQLTAGDLQTEQQANRRQHEQLGLAVGEGIVTGLEVQLLADGADGKPPVVRVTGGLALNRIGHALSLPSPVEVMLSQKDQPPATAAGLFAVCDQKPTAPDGVRGVFVLLLAPTSGYLGRAPRRGLDEERNIAGCGDRYAVEGVRFRLQQLNLTELEKDAPLTVAATRAAIGLNNQNGMSLLRNLLAHLCFGTEALSAFAQGPFQLQDGISPWLAYGALDALRENGRIDPCEIPLALIYWPTQGVEFIDRWSVRRRVTQPLDGDPWPLDVSQRRPAESEAIFLQFQAQVRQMLNQTNLAAVTAKSRFRYLPAAGYLPVDTGQFVPDTFFSDLVINPQQLDAAFLRLLVQQSWYLPPIDLESPPPIRVYSNVNLPGYLVFMRDERPLVPQPSEPAEPDEPGPTPPTGTIRVDVSLGRKFPAGSPDVFLGNPKGQDKALRGLGIRDQLTADGQIDKKKILVFARDEFGRTYPGHFVFRGAGRRPNQGSVSFRSGIARFKIRSLPPGVYRVYVKVKGFKTAIAQRTLSAGQNILVQFRLVPSKSTGGKRPSKPPAASGEWIAPSWYKEMHLMEKFVRWPWPPEPELAAKFDQVFDPPPTEVDDWIDNWVEVIHTERPDAPIDPGGIRLLIDKQHTPDAVADQPYAYLVFGEHGAYAPVLLTSKDATLDRQVPLGTGALPGVNAATESLFGEVGVKSLNMLAAGWKGMVAEVMGVGSQTAASVITTTRETVDALQGSLLIFSGVNQTINDALVQAGIDGPAALANADPQALVNAVGSDVLNPTLASMIVDQARAALPTSTWSLDAPQLGLGSGEIDRLRAIGVTTQGGLKVRAATPAGQSEIAAALGTSTGAITNLAGGIVFRKTDDVRITRRADAPVTATVGVDRATGQTLARLGFDSVGQLANADPNVVARAFGGDMGRTNAAIQAAKQRIANP